MEHLCMCSLDGSFDSTVRESSRCRPVCQPAAHTYSIYTALGVDPHLHARRTTLIQVGCISASEVTLFTFTERTFLVIPLSNILIPPSSSKNYRKIFGITDRRRLNCGTRYSSGFLLCELPLNSANNLGYYVLTIQPRANLCMSLSLQFALQINTRI